MRSRLLFSAVDSHTEGMPTRVVTGGFAPIPGETMNDKRRYFQQNLDHLRTLTSWCRWPPRKQVSARPG